MSKTVCAILLVAVMLASASCVAGEYPATQVNTPPLNAAPADVTVPVPMETTAPSGIAAPGPVVTATGTISTAAAITTTAAMTGAAGITTTAAITGSAAVTKSTGLRTIITTTGAITATPAAPAAAVIPSATPVLPAALPPLTELVVTPVITQPVTTTLIITYTPPAPTDAERSGRCWAGSLAVWREGAWRCVAGNTVLDPCFLDASGQKMICGGHPLANRATFALKLADALGAPLPVKPTRTPRPGAAVATRRPVTPVPEVTRVMEGPENDRHAWVLLLADGTTCTFATGSSGLVSGQRITYLCSGTDLLSGTYVVVLGDLLPGKVWQAVKARVTAGIGDISLKELATVPIRTLWR